MHRKLLTFCVSLCALVGLPLLGQSYQSSFSDLKYDRAKAPSTFHSDVVSVEAPTGAVNIRVPMGPGLGERGAKFMPMMVGRISPKVSLRPGIKTIPNILTSGCTTTVWTQTLTLGYSQGTTANPGMFTLHGPAIMGMVDNDDPMICTFKLPDGSEASVNQLVPFPSGLVSVAELPTLLKDFGYDADITVVSQARLGAATSGDSPALMRSSEGDLVMGLYHPTKMPEYSAKAVECGGNLDGNFWYYPNRFLVIRGDVAYEFATPSLKYKEIQEDANTCSGTVVHPTGTTRSLMKQDYRLSRIINRFGESIDFAYAVLDPDMVNHAYVATWMRGGQSTGQTISTSLVPGEPIEDPISGEITGHTPSYHQLTYTMGAGNTLNFVYPISGAGSVRCLETGESVSVIGLTLPTVSWGSDSVTPQAASGVQLPGRTLSFTWEPTLFRENDFSTSWSGYSQWLADTDTHITRSWTYGVTKVVDTDTTTGVSRTTTYTRHLPVPDTATTNRWTDTQFYVGIQHPDGQSTLQFYTQPLNNGKNNGPADGTFEEQLQTAAHLKHVLKESRDYAAGVDWSADVSSAASSSSAFRIAFHDRLDMRSVGNPTGDLRLDPVPYATRTRVWDKQKQTLHVDEKTDFDADNYAWKTHHADVALTGSPDVSFDLKSLAKQGASYAAPANRVAGSSSQVQSFSSNKAHWLFGRPTQEQTNVGSDTTGYSTESAGGNLPPVKKFYDDDSTFGRSLIGNRLMRTIAGDAGDTQVTTDFNYPSDSGPSAAQLSAMNLTGATASTALQNSGQVGISEYLYDNLGYLRSIKPKGVNWTVQQSQDAFGRPQVQTDANGRTTTYTWDAAGRLTGIAPQDLQATSIAYDSDFMGATVTRGAQKTQYRYNGYGQVIRVARWDASGASHQSIGYYPDGRKRWESIWLTGTGNDSEWTSTTAPGAATTYEYDGQGRVTKVIDPNGVATQTAYNGLSRTVTVGGIVTTYVSDAKGRLVQVLSPALADGTKPLTVYKYDKADRIARVEQYPNSANGVGSGTAQIRTWAYNSLGWLTSLVQPESGTTAYSNFDVTGKPWATTYGSGSTSPRSLSTTFDSLGRVLSVVGSDVNQSFVYDQVDAGGRAASSFGAAQGKLIYSRDKGIELFRTYSGMGGAMSAMDTRIWADGAVNNGTSWMLPQTFTTDSYGNRTQSTAGRSVVDTFYDLSKGLPSGLGRNGTTVMTATLDAVAWNVAGLNYGTNWGTSFSYDSDQTRLHAMNHLTPGKAPVAWTYSYDTANRLTGDGEDAYSYDNLGRLVSATVTRLNATTGLADPTRKMVESYSYDAFGNMTKKTATGTKPTTLNEFAFTATEIGLMAQTNRLPASTGASYDVQGNLTQIKTKSGATIKLTYDALARVIVCFDSSRNVQERYFYTPEGLRTLVEEWNTTGTTLNKRRVNLYNDARQLVSQYEVAAATQTLKTLAAQSTSVRAAALVEPCGASIDAPESGTVYTKGTAISFRGSSDTYGATLSWNFGDGKSGSGAAPSHAYAAGGTYTVKLTASATGWANSVSTISVVIVDPTVQAPVISSFTSSSATLMPGSSATLAWAVTGATSLKINSSAVTGTSLSVSPTRTTVYTLVATNTKGSTSATVTINMPPVITFTASPAVISPGQSSTLSWTVADATSVTYQNQTPTSNLTGSATEAPSGNTEYKVTASNAVGSTTASIAVVLDVPGLTWKRDIIYLGTKEAAEFDANGMHVTQVDHLGSPRIVTNASGAVELRQKYLPFGEALDTVALLGSLTTAKGFTNHEQTDASGLIYMQARFYLPMYGRFGSPDPARDQHFEATQSWNIYSYVCNSPTMSTDPTGMLKLNVKDIYDSAKEAVKTVVEETGKFMSGAGDAIVNANTLGIAEATGLTNREPGLSYSLGRAVGDGLVMCQGGAEVAAGGGGAVLGVATGPGEIVIGPAGVAVAIHGTAVSTAAAVDTGMQLMAMIKGGGETGSYTNTHESGKTYDGKGDQARSQESGKRVEAETGDKHTATEWKPAKNAREAFKDESKRLDSHGGAKSPNNHNKIESPGKKMRIQDGEEVH